MSGRYSDPNAAAKKAYLDTLDEPTRRAVKLGEAISVVFVLLGVVLCLFLGAYALMHNIPRDNPVIDRIIRLCNMRSPEGYSLVMSTPPAIFAISLVIVPILIVTPIGNLVIKALLKEHTKELGEYCLAGCSESELAVRKKHGTCETRWSVFIPIILVLTLTPLLWYSSYTRISRDSLVQGSFWGASERTHKWGDIKEIEFNDIKVYEKGRGTVYYERYRIGFKDGSKCVLDERGSQIYSDVPLRGIVQYISKSSKIPIE